MQHKKVNIPFLSILIAGLLLIFGCSGGNQEDKPPIPGGNGVLTIENVLYDSVTVRWTPASDENTPTSFLDYLVVYSTSSNIADLASAESNGKKAPVYTEDPDSDKQETTYWNKNIQSIKIKDLEDGILYYFNVIARDRSWGRSAYQMTSQKTVDITAPVPGNAGLVSINNEAIDSNSKVSLTLTWTKASDNNTSGASVLEYLVVQSTSADISTLNGALNKIPTPPDKPDWIKDINAYDISDLPLETIHYFNVIVRDEAHNMAVYTMTSQAPTAGDLGALSISDELQNGLTLNWTKAEDGGNDPSLIEYRVIRSTEDNIDRLEQKAEENDETPAIEQKWYKDIDSLDIVGLIEGQEYFFNVIAKDLTGFKTIYRSITNSPTPGGAITISNAKPNSLTLNWVEATDSGSGSGTLSYLVVRSFANDIKTVQTALENGSPLQTWTKNIRSLDVTGLEADTTYYFNVVVKDETEHKSAYYSVSSFAESRVPKESSAILRSASAFVDNNMNTLTMQAIQTSSNRLKSVSTGKEQQTPLTIDRNPGHLILWIDGEDPSATGVAVFEPIETWKDKSGQENHAEQSVETSRPTPDNMTPLNGRPSVRFTADQKNYMLVSLGADILTNTAGSAYTIIMVAGNLGNERLSSPPFLLDCSDANGNRNGLYYYHTQEGKTAFAVRTDKDYPLQTLVPETPFIVTAVFGKNSANRAYGSVTVDDQTENLPESFHIPSGITRILIGAGWCNGAPPDVSGFLNGNIGELILFDRTLTSDEHQKMIAYLKNKWGLNEYPQ